MDIQLEENKIKGKQKYPKFALKNITNYYGFLDT